MLTDIELFQFKKFKNEHFDLLPLTLLTGMNGMGKSSLIQSLLILRQSFDRGELQNNGKIIIEDKELVNLISPDDMLCSSAENSKVSITLADNAGNKATWTMKAEGYSNTLPFIYDMNIGNIYNSSLFSDSFQYINAERMGPRANYERLKITRPHSPIGYKGEYAASKLLDVVTKLDIVELNHAVIKGYGTKVYDQLSAWMSEIICPGTKITPDNTELSSIKLEYSFREEQTKTFNPLNIGFGFSFTMPVILAILTAKPGSLLIIENPEAHLHPKGQARMGKLLALAAMSGLQVIIESHSDHILNGIRIATKEKLIAPELIKIIFFGSPNRATSEKYTKIEPKIDINGRIDQWPSDFFDTWEYSLMDLL